MKTETTDTRRTDQDIYEDVIKANQTTSDTPETDGKKKRICGNWNNAGDRVQDFVLADFARKLERERDKAREDLQHAHKIMYRLRDEVTTLKNAVTETGGSML